MNQLKKYLMVGSTAIVMSIANADELGKPVLSWTSSGFAHPESARFDATRENVYVTNNDGGPMAQKGEGYISRLDKNGKVLDEHWVTGINAPKGIVQSGDLLYIADIQQVRVVDINTGKVKQSITAQDSKMFNGITVDAEGNVYISDIMGGAIYRLQGETLEKWIETDAFSSPNGVLVDGNRLLVVTWGEGMHEDFSTDELGSIFAIDLKTKEVKVLEGAEHIGNLDGIAKINGNLIVSDSNSGKIFQYSEGKTQLLLESGRGSADISSYGDNLLVPVMFDGTVYSYSLKK
ncbi:PQQ-binding-like beta-propeller repeat protein [Otariodibacter oris]|uniref:Putative pyrroloquinoline-quinone binding quinoprotein n=1 Tax=Otariodibacter oris TaxID=1032623 RepID=A0A420XH33_9PAST|nr:PQQ-binding-like beta-propeller repeat protein [Otariodibacter oris]RKR72747.1 putative pyrroloquinoline-quinone binding quinoprotein [Otariodibacter oris]